MTEQPGNNRIASIRQRLLNLSRERGDEFQLVLTHYGIERFLYRLSKSQFSNRFILKGAMLFSAWTTQPYRSTRDLDLLGRGNNSPAEVEAVIRDICGTNVKDDGLVFDESSVNAEPIRENQEYEGVRVALIAWMGKARINLQVDIGFGDALFPGEQSLVYPTLLDLPAPEIKAYSKESMVAEKLQAIVTLGAANSRMKDFYDIWMLARSFDFEGEVLGRAIAETFQRRQTDLPKGTPYGLSKDFANDPTKQTQWGAFVKRGKLLERPQTFTDVLTCIGEFAMPPALAVAAGQSFVQHWYKGGIWRSR